MASVKVSRWRSVNLVASMSMSLSIARYLGRAACMVEIVVRFSAVLGAGVGSRVIGGCWLELPLASSGGGVLAIAGGCWGSCV